MTSDTPASSAWPFYRFVRAVCRCLIRVFWGGVTVRGMENVPATGSFLLAPNHRANVDPPYISMITPRPMYFMGKAELFRVPFFGAVFRGVRAFPVKRGAPDRAALRHAMNLLKDGQGVVIFPEGTRSIDTTLGEAEKGFALIARQSNAVIVPVALEGTEKVLPKGATRLRRAHVTVTVGKPLVLADLVAAKPESEKDVLAWIGAETMRTIGTLLNH